MSKFSVEAKVGVFVILGILLLGYMSMKVGKFTFSRESGYDLSVEFDSATGLAVDVPVEIAGVEVGRVRSISLRDGKASVVLRIRPEVKIYGNAKAIIRTRGILGDKYIALNPGSPEEPPMKSGDRIAKTEPTSDMDTLMNSLQDVAADIKALSGSLGKVLGGEEGEASVRNIIQNLKEMIESLNQTVQKNRNNIDAIIANLTGFSETLKSASDVDPKDIQGIVKNLSNASAKMDEMMNGVNQIVAQINEGKGSLGKLIKEEEAIKNLNATLASLRDISEKINQGKGTIGKLINEDAAAKDLNATLASIKEISDKINRGEGSIGKLVHDEETVDKINSTLSGINDFLQKQDMFKTFIDYRGEYLFDSDDMKSYISLRIQPKEDKYYLLQVVDDPEGKKTTTRITRKIDGKFSEEERVEIEEDEFKFSAQIAKRYYDLTLRGGLFESTGGIGVDYHLFNDRLTLSLEAFDFGSDDNPHLKFIVNYSPLKHLYITSGYDRFISDEGKESFFLGAGIRFADEDIKTLISTVPFPKN
jgi:phospholipid/cholesterol/gamma-HCH transport system substrate-binding protein